MKLQLESVAWYGRREAELGERAWGGGTDSIYAEIRVVEDSVKSVIVSSPLEKVDIL